MIVELTLLSTFIFYHLLLGLFIGGLLWTLFKLPFNISPRTRSMLWFTCYLLITLLPFSAFFGSNSPQPASVKPAYSQPLTSTGQPPATAISTPIQTPEQATWNVSQDLVNALAPVLSFLLLVWFIGIEWRVALLLRRIYNSCQLGRNTVQKQQITLNITANQGKTNEHVELTIWLSDNCTSPMVIGLFNPKILVPKALVAQLNEQQLRHVILHEQAHIERKDLLAVSLQEVISITFWWSPVMRPLNRQIHLARKLACDFKAAHKANEPLKYAQTLLDCAKLMFAQKQNVLAMSLFNQKKDLTVRIDEVINIQPGDKLKPIYALGACAMLVVSSYAFALFATPKVDIGQIKVGAKLFSRQTPVDSQRMIAAVVNNRLQELHQMVNEGLDIDVAVIGDGTALIMAVQSNKLAMVDGILNLGANVNQPSVGDGNPLIMAARRANLVIIKRLVEAGANVNAEVIGDETPLINASLSGDLEVVRYLVEHGSDVNQAAQPSIFDDNEPRTPLGSASTKAVREYLIGRGAK
jgi:bla regulator protein BlaR1